MRPQQLPCTRTEKPSIRPPQPYAQPASHTLIVLCYPGSECTIQLGAYSLVTPPYASLRNFLLYMIHTLMHLEQLHLQSCPFADMLARNHTIHAMCQLPQHDMHTHICAWLATLHLIPCAVHPFKLNSTHALLCKTGTGPSVSRQPAGFPFGHVAPLLLRYMPSHIVCVSATEETVSSPREHLINSRNSRISIGNKEPPKRYCASCANLQVCPTPSLVQNISDTEDTVSSPAEHYGTHPWKRYSITSHSVRQPTFVRIYMCCVRCVLCQVV
jgi:hypothetical protein